MVSKQTVLLIQKEYREYLMKKQPDWSKERIQAHVTDAFFLWNHDIVDSFWSCFGSEQAMEQAREELISYLEEYFDKENARKQGMFYYEELKRFQNFIHDTYGSIEKKVGEEIKAEEEIYSICKAVYEKKISLEEGIDYLVKHVGMFGERSHKFAILLFKSLVQGEKYSYQVSTELLIYFIKKIKKDYGEKGLKNALWSTYENIRYCYEQTGSKSEGLRRKCAQIARENGVLEQQFEEQIFDGIVPKGVLDTTLANKERKPKYWLYSAGNLSKNWEKDYQEQIMAIGWDDIGDLSLYASKEEMKQKMKAVYGEQYSYKNQAHATWQFAQEMEIGDIVFVKRGRKKIIGKGIVEGEYQYDTSRSFFKNVRKVNWIENSEHEAPVPSVLKTLTEITPYTEYVKSLELLFVDQEDIEENEIEQVLEPYTENDFLSDVYLSEKRYHELKNILLMKKNIILQGPSGVGKTYTAKRLAYSIMGEQRDENIKMIQFHQSYSYEDFIIGFRPTKQGFELKKGPFYSFCKKAEVDSENPYFFIIDEINRGNLSKIFGELFMLLENDKRGVELQLLYSDELFSVPQNVYLIGMMNTADRSLALLDYALRRRFAFFEFVPAFDSEGFLLYQKKLQNKKFDRLVSVVKKLNEAIVKDEMLGKGFQIGHSYFCAKTAVNDEWLMALVEFELIPLLEEYWFDEQRKVKEWSLLLKEAIQ